MKILLKRLGGSMESNFTVICNNCNSDKVIVKQEYDYNYEENLIATNNYFLECLICGTTDNE